MEHNHARQILAVHLIVAACNFLPSFAGAADTNKTTEVPRKINGPKSQFDLDKIPGPRKGPESVGDSFFRNDPFSGPAPTPLAPAPLSKEASEKLANDRNWIFANPNEQPKEKTLEQQLGISKYDSQSGSEQTSHLGKFLNEGNEKKQAASSKLQSEAAKSFLYGSPNEREDREKKKDLDQKAEKDAMGSLNPNLKLETFMTPGSNPAKEGFGRQSSLPVFGQNSAAAEVSRQQQLEKKQERQQKFEAIYDNPSSRGNDMVKSSGLLDPITKLKDMSRQSANPTVPGYEPDGPRYTESLTGFRPAAGAGMIGDITSRSLGIAPKSSADVEVDRHIKPEYHPGVLPFPKRPGSYSPGVADRRP